MRARAAIAPLIAMLALLALLGAGCFESSEGGTVSEAVTIGVGTNQTTVGANGEATTGAEETTETSSETTETSSETTETGESSETESTTETGGGEDFTAAKASFANTCGGCHTLSDAGTSGNVGPNLDQTSYDAAAIEEQIKNGGGAMPPGLLQGDEAKAVAAYVAAVKSG
jgi:mono/diheme cytochrome c family protein